VAESRTLKLTYESNTPGVGKICILVPKNRQPEELTIDGEKKALNRRVTGEDTYGCVSTDWKAHNLELQFSDAAKQK